MLGKPQRGRETFLGMVYCFERATLQVSGTLMPCNTADCNSAAAALHADAADRVSLDFVGPVPLRQVFDASAGSTDADWPFLSNADF